MGVDVSTIKKFPLKNGDATFVRHEWLVAQLNQPHETSIKHVVAGVPEQNTFDIMEGR